MFFTGVLVINANIAENFDFLHYSSVLFRCRILQNYIIVESNCSFTKMSVLDLKLFSVHSVGV